MKYNINVVVNNHFQPSKSLDPLISQKESPVLSSVSMKDSIPSKSWLSSMLRRAESSLICPQSEAMVSSKDYIMKEVENFVCNVALVTTIQNKS